MAQEGSYVKRNGWWLFRYRESVVEKGERKRVLRARRLATLADIPPKRQRRRVGGGEAANDVVSRTKFDDVPDAVKRIAREFLDSANDNRRQPEQVRKMGEFVESAYLPWAQEQLKPSTLKEYSGIWQRHLKARASDIWLRDVRTHDVNHWLLDIARQNRELTSSSLQRVKSFLSGIFTNAKNQGYFDGMNPVRDADLPKAPKGQKTHAYTLAEIDLTFKALSDDVMTSTIIAVAAFAGLRRGEIRGLRWEEYNGVELRIVRAIWESYIGETKTEASGSESEPATVPVIAPLRERLEQWSATCGNPTSGWIFPSERSTPIHLGNLINRKILPALKAAGLQWKGFHSYRRGLGTNLHELGVPTETIKLILRHADVATTQRHYIKPRTAEVQKAMDTFEAHWKKEQEQKDSRRAQPQLLN
jgi:integrase